MFDYKTAIDLMRVKREEALMDEAKMLDRPIAPDMEQLEAVENEIAAYCSIILGLKRMEQSEQEATT